MEVYLVYLAIRTTATKEKNSNKLLINKYKHSSADPMKHSQLDGLLPREHLNSSQAKCLNLRPFESTLRHL